MSCRANVFAVTLVLLIESGACFAQNDKLPVKVFILAGQSNMQGHAALRTIDWLGEDPTYGHLLSKIKHGDGSWAVRDDVWIHYLRDRGGLKQGKLTVGYGANDEKIGPELMFGQIVGDRFENPVLLIKTAWGGKSLAGDFRPPSSGGELGEYYQKMLAIARDVLDNLDEKFPELAGREYELAGFAWFQGWNDMVKEERVAEYEANMINFIGDLRKDLGAPDLPVVIGELGVGGEASAEKNQRMADIRKAQAGAAEHPDFAGTVSFVSTTPYWDYEAEELVSKYWIKRKWTDDAAHKKFEKMGSQPPYHYLGSGKIYSLVGYGLATAMVELCDDKSAEQ